MWLFVGAWYLRTSTTGALIVVTTSIVLGTGVAMLTQGCSPAPKAELQAAVYRLFDTVSWNPMWDGTWDAYVAGMKFHRTSRRA